MNRRMLWVGTPLLAAGLLWFAGAGDGRAQEGKAGEASGDLAKRDHTVRDFLYEVIEKGRILYNKNRDHSGCSRVYGNALVAVLPLLDHRPDLQKAISAGLGKAQQISVPWQQAFALREVIDRVRTATAPSSAPPPDDKKGGDKVPEDKKPGKEPEEKKPGKEPDEKGKDKDKGPEPEKGEEGKDAKKEDANGKGEGEERATVRGMVTFKGKPLTSGFVTFVSPEGRKYSASIRLDGTFAFRKVAVPAGRYKVVIDKSVSLGKGQPPPVPIPARYQSAETSPLVATLNRGENVFDLVLK
jgi:hypothetical protein